MTINGYLRQKLAELEKELAQITREMQEETEEELRLFPLVSWYYHG